MPHFLVSPARCDGVRAGHLLRPDGRSALAVRLRGAGASLGEVFTFASGLYFRGKLAYAREFAAGGQVLVITPDGALVPPETRIDRDELARLAGCTVDHRDPVYAGRLRDAAAALDGGPVVLLGSVRSPKYVGPLSQVLGDRLLFPAALASMGDMQRGSLLLRCAAERCELTYARTDLR